MPNWPSDQQLSEGQLAMPLLWMRPAEIKLFGVSDADLEPAFGPGKSRRLKSFGHDETGVHWLVTRSGTAMHTDPAYSRYTHHCIVRNDGFRIRGLDDTAMPPPMLPGTIYCLDTHSPHEVVPDARIAGWESRVYKVQLAVDSDEAMDFAAVFALFQPWLTDPRRHPRHTARTATMVAPKPKKGDDQAAVGADAEVEAEAVA